MKNLIIFGGSGIGMIACSVANDLGTYNTLGFLNDVVPVGSLIGKYNKVPVIGTTKDVDRFFEDENNLFFIAYVGMQNEEEVFNKIEALNIPSHRFATLIHPTAIVPKGYCSIGNGVLMSPLTQLSPDTTIEDNCILMSSSIIGHDSTMKRFSHLAADSIIEAIDAIAKKHSKKVNCETLCFP
ncbi:MAG: hypothetical protein EOM11_10930 [Erysipelotrichia bacterium]|nr:hypothetical protein [Erysipelotrichia bacterium]